MPIPPSALVLELPPPASASLTLATVPAAPLSMRGVAPPLPSRPAAAPLDSPPVPVPAEVVNGPSRSVRAQPRNAADSIASVTLRLDHNL
jgi:hypothetical protein